MLLEERRGEESKGEERTEEQESPPPSSTTSTASAVGSGSPFEKEDSLRGSGPPPTEEHDSPAVAEIIAMLKGCGIPAIAELEEGFVAFVRAAVRDRGPDASGEIGQELALIREHPDWIEVSTGGDALDRLCGIFNAAIKKEESLQAVPGQGRAKAEFLSALRSCPGYPFDEYEDTCYFNYAHGEFPGVDLVAKTKKKIDYWKKNPAALEGSKSPHEQLTKWFEGDFNNKK